MERHELVTEDNKPRRPSAAAFEKAGGLLYGALERLAIEDARRAAEEKVRDDDR